MKNSVQWFEIPTIDLERAKNFYSKVFNIEFEYIEMPGNNMYMFGNPEGIGSAGSLIQSTNIKPSSEGTVIYFSSEDISKELALVEKAGGKVLFPKSDIGDFGFFAQITDTEGNRIGLHSNK